MSTIPETEVYSDSIQIAYTVAPAAIGCAAGLLVGSVIENRTSRVAALTVLTIGAGFAIPSLIHFLKQKVSGPTTLRGTRRRLEGIRRAAAPEVWTEPD